MSRPGGGGAGWRYVRRDAGRQALDPVQQGRRDRRAHLVERGDGGINGLRPAGQVGEPGPVPVGPRRVIAVVARQVQAEQVRQRVLPVQFQFPEHNPRLVLERGQVGLVVHVLQGLAGPGGGRQLGQGGPHPIR